MPRGRAPVAARGERPTARWVIQPQFVAIVTVVCTLGVAAIGVAVQPEDRLWVVLLLGVPVLTALLVALRKAWLQELSKAGTLGSRGPYGPSGDKQWHPLSSWSPTKHLGLHPDVRCPQDVRLTSYFPRPDIDGKLVRALSDDPVVVLYGKPRSGKTRTLLEAVGGVDRELHDPLFAVTSARSLAANVESARALPRRRRPVVFWFRELDEEVVNALTVDIVDFLVATGSRVVVEARIEDRRRVGHLIPGDWTLLRLDDELRGDALTAAEDELADVRSVGADEDVRFLGWVLSDDLDPVDDFHAVKDPVVQSAVRAAVDWDRTGAPRGATAKELRAILVEPSRRGPSVPDALTPLLASATSQEVAGSARLDVTHPTDQPHYRSAKRLQIGLARYGGVPLPVWVEVVRNLLPEQLEPVRSAALHAGEEEIVKQIDRKMLDNSGRRRAGAPARPHPASPVDPPPPRRPSPPTSGSTRPPRPTPAIPRRRRVSVILGAGVVAMIAVIVGLLVVPGGSGPRVEAGPPTPSVVDTAVPAQAAVAPTTAATPPDSEGEAAAELDADVERDAAVAEGLVDRWVPQLSAKRVGTRDNGVIYQPSTIRDEFAAPRAYQTLTVSSDRWRNSFDGAGLWVLLANVPQNSERDVIAWCDSQRLTTDDQCFAVRLSRSGDWRSNSGYHR